MRPVHGRAECFLFGLSVFSPFRIPCTVFGIAVQKIVLSVTMTTSSLSLSLSLSLSFSVVVSRRLVLSCRLVVLSYQGLDSWVYVTHQWSHQHVMQYTMTRILPSSSYVCVMSVDDGAGDDHDGAYSISDNANL